MDSTKKAIEVEALRDMLVSTHLYYDAGTKSLRSRAFAEFIIKILFISPDKKARFAEISNELAKIINVPKLTVQDVQSGIEFLKEKGVIEKSGNFWFLKHKESERIINDLHNAQTRINHVLDKHFGSKIDRDILLSWFKDVSTEFFSRFSEIWVKKLKREASKLPNSEQIKTIILSSIKKHNLETEETVLLDGFNSFLRDNGDFVVEQQIWSFAQSMLAARLVTAGVGPDPLSIGEFHDAKLLLDTNVLLIAALEKSRLSSAFAALAASIKQIGASFLITRETEQEYEAVVARKRTEAIRAVENFPLDVLEESKDPFLKTAIFRGCVDKESFDTFFRSIQYAPDKIGDEIVEISDDPGVLAAVESGRKNTKKQSEIATEWKSQRHFDKPRRALEHDSALDSVVDYLRTNKVKSYVISSDGPMLTLVARWAGLKLPSWVGIDTLVQILAVSSGGPGHNPENFIPLFGTIIRDDIHCDDNLYTLEDLDALLDLEDRVKELDSNEIEVFASKMRHLRMSGKPKNDNELQLEIRRTFQRKKMTSTEVTRKLEKTTEEALESLKKENNQSALIMKAFVNRIYKTEKNRKTFWWLSKIVFILIVGIVLVLFGIKNIEVNNQGLGYLLVGIGITEFLLPLFTWLLPAYKKIGIEAKRISEDKAEKAIKII